MERHNYLAVEILVQWFRKLLSIEVFNNDAKQEIKGKNASRIKGAIHHSNKNNLCMREVLIFPCLETRSMLGFSEFYPHPKNSVDLSSNIIEKSLQNSN